MIMQGVVSSIHSTCKKYKPADIVMCQDSYKHAMSSNLFLSSSITQENFSSSQRTGGALTSLMFDCMDHSGI